jgi:hypothetical protein
MRITALMYVTMVLAALAVDLVFSALGLVPGERPTTADVFGTIELDYKAALNALGLLVFIALFALTITTPTKRRHRGAPGLIERVRVCAWRARVPRSKTSCASMPRFGASRSS